MQCQQSVSNARRIEPLRFYVFGFIRKTHWQLERSKLHQHTSKHCYCAKLNSSDDFVPFFDTPSCSISTRRRTWQDSRESRCHLGSRSLWRVPLCLRLDRELQQGSPSNQLPINIPGRQKSGRKVFDLHCFTFASFSTMSKVELSKKIWTTCSSLEILAAEKRIFCLDMIILL